MKQFSLGKDHRLCSPTAIDRLFAERGNCVGAWPLRAVWLPDEHRIRGQRVQILISIPKRRLRRAVDRVAMRRRVREAYRLNRAALQLPPGHPALNLAFIYTADSLTEYHRIERSMLKILGKLSAALAAGPAATDAAANPVAPSEP